MAQQGSPDQAGARGGPLKVVGRRGPNIDAIERVTGQAKYTGDIELPGMLVARILRSPHAHARVTAVDTSKAEALPGVMAVVTHRDAPKVVIWGHRHYVLNDRVRFAGEAVAAVAAVDVQTAERALGLIDVRYEPLPFVLDPEEAMKPDAPQLFEDGNLEGPPRTATRGDVEQGLRESDHVIERAYRCPTMWSGSLEPHAVVAQWESSRLTLWCSTQSPFRVHANMAAQFNLPDSHVRIVASYVGGGFGTKSAPHVDETIAALLARKAHRPVKLQYSREEEILDSNTRFEVKMYVRMGVKKAGMALHALDLRAFINQGAYHVRLGGLGNHATHLYNIPHLRTVQYRVHTNIPNTGPTRGVGDPQECFGLDSAVDEVANEMGWDPMEFRLKNIKRNGDPIPRAASGTEDGRLIVQVLDRCIEDGAARIEWQRRNARPGTATGVRLRGIGMACTERTGGGGLSGASVRVFLDGSIVVFYSSTDIGTGSRTTMSMIAAEVLGVPLSAVRAISGDTEAAPWDGGSQGNRTLQGTGRAVEAAAGDALRQLLATAAPLMKTTADALELVDGVVRVKSEPARTMTLAEVMQRRGRSIVGDGSLAVGGQQAVEVERTTAAHFAEVEVDTETGRVSIVRYVSAHDVGRPINVTIVENQIEGGTIQGLALTRAEEMRFDPRTGRTLNANFLELKPPTMLDFDARVIEAIIVPNEGQIGPFGGKGLGENPCHPGMAAVANAIYNATGVRLRKVPFTRGDILEALRERRGVRQSASI